mgnify:FL=1
MSEDRTELSMNDRGIFSITHRKLSAKGILAKRSRLQHDIVEARERIQFWTTKLGKLSRTLRALNEPVVNQYLKQLEHRKAEAEKKAQELLRGYLGEENYKTLQSKGRLSFTAKDGLTYRVNRRGHVFRGDRRLCIIRPDDLPLPDFILTALVNVKEKPRRFPARR